MIYVLLAALNERDGLSALLRRIRDVTPNGLNEYRILLVDDGSTDGSSDIAATFTDRLDIRIFRHETNRGLGAALRTGLEFILADSSEPDDIVVTMDADDSHDPAVISELVNALRDRNAGVAIASRFASGGAIVGVPPLRRFLSRGARLTCRALAPMTGVRDYSSGFRAFRMSTLRAARAIGDADLPVEDGFVSVLEVLLRARAAGATAVEVGFTLRYDRKLSASKMRLARTAKAWLVLLARSAWRDRAGATLAPPLAEVSNARKAV